MRYWLTDALNASLFCLLISSSLKPDTMIYRKLLLSLHNKYLISALKGLINYLEQKNYILAVLGHSCLKSALIAESSQTWAAQGNSWQSRADLCSIHHDWLGALLQVGLNDSMKDLQQQNWTDQHNWLQWRRQTCISITHKKDEKKVLRYDLVKIYFFKHN